LLLTTPAQWRSPRSHGKQGFTIIELLVVMIIMGVLSAIALPSMMNMTLRARQAEGQNYVGAINRAQQLYYMENGQFANLVDLSLGISQSVNYVYSSVPIGGGSTAEASTEATPLMTTRGYAGKVWISLMGAGSAATTSILCEGDLGTVPTIAGNTCPP
jgi:prepilin-type N-terminal cleavage/methylation domain-containing protein